MGSGGVIKAPITNITTIESFFSITFSTSAGLIIPRFTHKKGITIGN